MKHIVVYKNHNFCSLTKFAVQYFLSIVQQVFCAVEKLQSHHHPNSAVILNIFLIWIGAHKSTLLEWKYLKENHNLHFLKKIIFQQFLSCVQLFLHAIEKLHSHHHPISAVIL